MSVIHQLHYLKHPWILSSPQTLEDARCRLRSNSFKKTSLACMFFLRHFRSCGNTLEKCFFQISSYSCAHARIIYQRQLGIPLKQEVLLSFFIETLAISVLAYCIDTSLRYDFTNGLLFPWHVSLNYVRLLAGFQFLAHYAVSTCRYDLGI